MNIRHLAVLYLPGMFILLLSLWPQGVEAQDSGQQQWFLPLVVSNSQSATAENGVWTDVAAPAQLTDAERWVVPQQYRLVGADIIRLDALLASAPVNTGAVSAAAATGVIIVLPFPDGTMQRFQIENSPMMEAELAAHYPQITTYTGRGLDDPTATALLDRTPAGFHAMILSGSDTVFIDPFRRGDITLYASYYRKDYGNYWGKSLVEDTPLSAEITAVPDGSGVTAAASGPTLRTYRLALAATAEYTQFHDDGNAANGNDVADALAAMVTTMNRVNGLFRRDLAVQMNLVANTNLLIYNNAATDPYTNNNGDTMLGENQANIDAVITGANYDIGHVFSTGGGGVAGRGVVCNNATKARGVTGSANPIGDPFDIDFVAHEMGHQFNATHTFNASTVGSCTAGNRFGETAYEPGSGTTIMAYAGICGGQNLQANSDDHFHAGSIAQIINFVTAGAGNTCGVATATGNTMPTVNAGPNFTIPRQTPFRLGGTGNDTDGDALTFTWEQFDAGPDWTNMNVLPNTDADGSARAIFRSFSPVATAERTFPRLPSILDGTNSNNGESLSNIDRTMQFRLTARDGRGGVNDASMTVTVEDAAGPFAVTAPNAPAVWFVESTQTVQWDVANTTAAPVSCANVNISLSTDGGLTFPVTLAANTPNDGSQAVVVPDNATTTGRVKVACAGNIFFDISNANFTIRRSADLSITKSDDPDPVVAGTSLTYQLNIANAGPSGAQSVSVIDDLPAGVTLVSAVPSQGTCSGADPVTCTIGDLANGGTATIAIVVTVAPDLVYNAGAPATITNSATVSSPTSDPNPGNNSATQNTRVVASADLAILSFTAVNPPSQILVAQDVTVLLRKLITNLGPSAPMDVTLTKTGVGPADTIVTPAHTVSQELALGLNEQRTVDETFTVRCNGYSHHLFTFTNQIQPLRPDDTDPNQVNNTASVDLDIECVVPVAINIKPGSNPNTINPRNNGEIAVAVLTTKAGEYGKPLAFDATRIDPLSVRFGPRDCVWNETCGAFEIHQSGHVENVFELDERTKDGDKDMVLHFMTFDTGITVGVTEACVKGAWIDGSGDRHTFFGCDAVRVK